MHGEIATTWPISFYGSYMSIGTSLPSQKNWCWLIRYIQWKFLFQSQVGICHGICHLSFLGNYLKPWWGLAYLRGTCPMLQGADQPSPFHLNFSSELGARLLIRLPSQHPESLFVDEHLSLLVTPACHRLLMNFWVLSNQERVHYKQLPSLSSSCSPLLILSSPLGLYMQWISN